MGWGMLLVTGWLLVAGIMDVKSRRVPIWMLVSGGVLAVCIAFGRHNGFQEALKGLLPGAMLLLVAFATKKAGYGDGMVLGCLGMVLGGGKSLLLFGLSLFLTSLYALALLALRKAGRNTGLPFLPFLGAAWIMVVYL